MKLTLQAEVLNIVASVFFKVVSLQPVRSMVCKQFVTKNAINMVSIFDIMVSQRFKSKCSCNLPDTGLYLINHFFYVAILLLSLLFLQTFIYLQIVILLFVRLIVNNCYTITISNHKIIVKQSVVDFNFLISCYH